MRSLGAASIPQMNLGRAGGRVGGLLEAKKIAGMAEAHYAQIAPRLYCGPVVWAENINISKYCQTFLILKRNERCDGFQARLIKTPIRWQHGYVIPPTAPGLGVERDAAVAAAPPYAGSALRRKPTFAPVDTPERWPVSSRNARQP